MIQQHCRGNSSLNLLSQPVQTGIIVKNKERIDIHQDVTKEKIYSLALILTKFVYLVTSGRARLISMGGERVSRQIGKHLSGWTTQCFQNN